jgi:hypothetical protein
LVKISYLRQYDIILHNNSTPKNADTEHTAIIDESDVPAIESENREISKDEWASLNWSGNWSSLTPCKCETSCCIWQHLSP